MTLNTGHNKSLNIIISLLLCTVFLFQVFNKFIYTHTHVLADGTIVSHAHPYNKQADSSPFKKHYHTKFEFVLLSQLNYLFCVFTGSITIGLLSRNIFICKRSLLFYNFCYSSYIQGRSPPLQLS